MNRRRFPLSLLGLIPAVALADDDDESRRGRSRDEPRPAAREDVESIDSIIDALYEVISGPEGRDRDWDRFRSLFHTHARLVPVVRHEDDSAEPRVLDVEEFIEIAGPAFEEDGFYEREIARTTERFGHIAHAFSTYEARRARREDPFIRGINSIQLVHDGERWWVLTITWDTERRGHPIPEEYLPDC